MPSFAIKWLVPRLATFGCMEPTLLPKIRRRISGGSSKETIEIRRILEHQFIGNQEISD
jgi:hypothetical protein